jgi:GWxTD domain-containing protein
MAVLGLILVVCCAGPAVAAPASGEPLTDQLQMFIQDEVRYIISDDEQAEWDGLTTNAEREEFAKRFWAKRDPDPSTPENEYRQEHHRRMAACKGLFRGEGRPGWLTDRGRIYIIFGPPDEVREEGPGNVMSGGSRLTAGGSQITPDATHGRIVWTYRAPDNPYLGPNTQIVFTGTPGGRYVLDSEVNAGAEAAFFTSQLGRTTRDDAIQQPKTLEDVKTIPKQQLSGPTDTLHADLLAGKRPQGAQVIALEASYFPVGEPQLYVPVRFRIGSAPVQQAMSLEARLYADPPGDTPVKRLEAPLEPGGDTIHSFGFMLDPGRYRLSVSCQNGEGGVAAAGTAAFEVPDVNAGGLMTSSVLLATSARPRESGVVDFDNIHNGLQLGNFILQAALGNAVKQGSAHPYIIYLVSGASPNDAGALDLGLNYRILRAEDGELVRTFPEQSRDQSFVAHALPVTDLPADAYRLELTVKDKNSAQEFSREVAFRVQ